MTQKFKVLVTRKWPNPVEKKLKESFDVTLNENDIPMSEEQLIDAVNNFDALLPEKIVMENQHTVISKIE